MPLFGSEPRYANIFSFLLSLLPEKISPGASRYSPASTALLPGHATAATISIYLAFAMDISQYATGLAAAGWLSHYLIISYLYGWIDVSLPFYR